MILTIESVSNGYTLTYTDELEDGSPSMCIEVFEEPDTFTSEEPPVEHMQRLLWRLLELIGPTTSRYSKERICIRVEPGDKYEAPENAKV